MPNSGPAGARPLLGVLLLAALAACTPNLVRIPATSLKVNGDSLHAMWSHLVLDSAHHYTRLGLNCGGCKVPVTIEGIAGNQGLDPQHPPATPQPVAHIVNTGNVDTEMYGFKPNYDAYFTVVRDSSGGALWGIVQFPRNQGTIYVTRGRGVHECLPPHSPKGSDADFKTCDDAHHVVHSSGSVLELAERGFDWIRSAMKAIDAAEDPGWFSCTDGCCTLSTSAS